MEASACDPLKEMELDEASCDLTRQQDQKTRKEPWLASKGFQL